MVEPVSSLVIPYAFSSLTTSLSNYASGHFNREETKAARWEQFAFQQGLESQRQTMQMAQMKLSVLQRQEDKAFQEKLAKENREFQLEIEKFRQSVNLAINQNNINFQKWRFEREKELQLIILNLNQTFQRKLNQNQHQNVLEQIKTRIRNERSPIQILADDILSSDLVNGIEPLRILLSPPELDYDVNKPQGSRLRVESFLAEEIRQFIKQGYSTNSSERPTLLLDRAWSSKKYGGGGAVQPLHNQLKTIPVLILESEFGNNDCINLRFYYWDGENKHRLEDSILSRYCYKDFLLNSAKLKAIEWRKTKAELLASGLDEAKVRTLATGYDEENLAILEDEEQTIALVEAANKDISKLNIGKGYKISNEDWSAFYDYLAFLHCIAIGTVADILALQHTYQLQPLLPKLLPAMLSKLDIDTEVSRETIKPMIKLYRNFYQGIEKHTKFASLVPDLTLDFALSLTDLSDKYFALEEAEYSASVWLKLNGVEPEKVFDLNSDEDCQLLKSIIYQEDKAYLTKLQQLVEKVSDSAASSLAQINSLIAGWQNLKRWGGNIPILSDLEKVKAETAETKQNQTIQEKEKKLDRELSVFNFETVTVDCFGEITERKSKQAEYYTEILPNGVELEMVKIPGGIIEVLFSKRKYGFTLPEFYMGKYPITQSQWKAISRLPKINVELAPEASYFQENSLPGESITWSEAVEFCHRLSAFTDKNYRLPSNIAWEYAGRGKAETPYHFGKTITDKLCNCKKFYQNKTTVVGNFYPNNFGLYDIHGNVWEYCADYWSIIDDTSFSYEHMRNQTDISDKGAFIDNYEEFVNEKGEKEFINEFFDEFKSAWQRYYDKAISNELYESERPKVLRGGSWNDNECDFDTKKVFYNDRDSIEYPAFVNREEIDYLIGKKPYFGFRVMQIRAAELSSFSQILNFMISTLPYQKI